ncbi:cobalamin biosynthesis protein [Catenuloplanes indicus JCM 9534]|uniref:Cobalamin biosynthesis protein CobD n=1 Tax=Catenuloplanes indicus TaxID=137267 RepID=A0AAE4AXP4_9ACTN|nr:cobalamin biosynthesis protein [Catenuloplanes indicus]MDQ0366437.1 adenosylcobinamide-phosphate synthase [Catenuloplanes indicus]
MNAGRLRVAEAVGMLAGYGLDAVFGDPRRWHPVAGFGTAASALEKRVYAPDRAAGACFAAVAVGTPVLAGAALAGLTRRRPVMRAVAVAAATWTVLGARTLRAEAHTMAGALDRGDIEAARGRLGHLCGRDPSALDEPELARATVESVAENTSDAVVAPLFWGAVAGLPGLLGYRAANTLDAMVGHRSTRYVRFGTPAARLDDALNLAPSRLTAALTVALAPLAGGDPARALRIWLRDGHHHPSPNAGQCESSMAGALGIRLGGHNVYFGRSEFRPHLGEGTPPLAPDIARAARLSGAVGLAAATLAATYRLTIALRARRSTTTSTASATMRPAAGPAGRRAMSGRQSATTRAAGRAGDVR